MIRGLLFFHVIIAGLTVSGQTYSPKLNQKLAEIEHATTLVKEFESFGIKSHGSQAKTNTFNWLIDAYESYGYDSIRVDSFIQDGSVVRNVVVTKPGVSSKYIIVCGHYDTRNGPGANDNGSGVAAILETARLIKDLKTNRCVIFINFDREEDGFKGSNYHVWQVLGGQNCDTNLYMVLNIDQIGGSFGQPDNDKITCERDEENDPSFNNALSYLLTDTIASLCKLYTTLQPEISNAFLSDYVPFEKQGYVITGLYQSASDVFGHSLADTFGNMDTVSFKQAVRLTMASTLYFAQVDSFVSVKEDVRSQFRLFPNPATDQIHVELKNEAESVELVDVFGRIVFFDKPSHPTTIINTTHVVSGSYFVRIVMKTGAVITSPVIIQHK